MSNTSPNSVWVYLPGANILGNSTGRSRKPFAVIGVSMFGLNQLAGRARLEMQIEQGGLGSNVWGTAQTVSEAAVSMSTGTLLTLSGGLLTPTAARVRLLVSISRQAFNSTTFGFPQSNHYSGIFVGLR